MVDTLSVDGDRAGVRAEQAQDQLEQYRFARSTRAEQEAHAAFRYREADVAEHLQVVEGEGYAVDHDGVGHRDSVSTLSRSGLLARHVELARPNEQVGTSQPHLELVRLAV